MRPAMKFLLQGIGSLLLVIAGLSFFWGGRALHEFLGVDRLLAELGGLTLAAVAGLLGMLAKGAGDTL
ncbi:hypothetical protein [Granulicella rosea]|nr:hypothetical protein [Granulicella rosea]